VGAETREQARDAADRVVVDLDQHPAVTSVDAARQPGAALVHEDFGTNVAYQSTRTWGDVAAAFDRPHRVVHARLRNQRLAGVPIEPRGVLAEASRWEPVLTVWSSTQIPHGVRDELAAFLSMPQTDVRVIAPAVGVGLGPLTRRLVCGCYRVPALQVDIESVYTNTTPIAAYRGAGRPEAIFLIERMVDLAARELAMDPVEFRRRNLLPRFETPVTTIAGENYDSGDYPAALERVLENADYGGLRRRQDEARAQGRLIGIGVASYVEMAGFGPSGDLFESAVVRVNPDGAVTVVTGTSPHGQG